MSRIQCKGCDYKPSTHDTIEGYCMLCAAKKISENAKLKEALQDMVQQFAYWSDKEGGYWTGGLSALEHAFGVLDWDDPMPWPSAQCQVPGCKKQITCGTNTPEGYKNVCSEHCGEINRRKQALKT